MQIQIRVTLRILCIPNSPFAVRSQVTSSVKQCVCLNKQATIVQGPDDSIHRAAAQCKAEGVAGSPVHTHRVLDACILAHKCECECKYEHHLKDL